VALNFRQVWGFWEQTLNNRLSLSPDRGPEWIKDQACDPVIAKSGGTNRFPLALLVRR